MVLTWHASQTAAEVGVLGTDTRWPEVQSPLGTGGHVSLRCCAAVCMVPGGQGRQAHARSGPQAGGSAAPAGAGAASRSLRVQQATSTRAAAAAAVCCPSEERRPPPRKTVRWRTRRPCVVSRWLCRHVQPHTRALGAPQPAYTPRGVRVCAAQRRRGGGGGGWLARRTAPPYRRTAPSSCGPHDRDSIVHRHAGQGSRRGSHRVHTTHRSTHATRDRRLRRRGALPHGHRDRAQSMWRRRRGGEACRQAGSHSRRCRVAGGAESDGPQAQQPRTW